MKTINLILLLLIFDNCIYAQPFGEATAGYRIVKTDYENSTGEKAITFFRYNYNGKLYKAFWVTDDKKRSSINFYQHNAEGYLVSAYRIYSDSLTSFELFSYDSLGYKISEYFFGPGNKSGFTSYRYKDNRLEQADMVNYKGWLNGTLKYSYNQQNRKESAVLLKGDKTICLISYEYDQNYNLKKEYWDFMGTWNQIFIYHYEKMELKKNYYPNPVLTNNGEYRICKENYTYNDEIRGPSIYYYRDDGKVNKKVFIRSDSVSSTTFYDYDHKGNLVKSKRNYSGGEMDSFNYFYDIHDNLVLRNCYRADTLSGFESYIYNPEGELLTAYYKNSDNWLSGVINYQYNELGLISNGYFKGEDDFDAMISFNYNDNNILNEIIWQFTFGKYQKYNFEYELAY